jgi:predicted glycosyltransferase
MASSSARSPELEGARGRPATKPVLLFHCQHSLGLGHLARAFSLVRAMSSEFRVVVLNGGRFPAGFDVPDGVEVRDLAPLGMNGDGGLVSLDHRCTVEQAQGLRRLAVMDAFETLAPAAIVIEMFPFGRKKFAGEILPLLQAARLRANRPFVACSLRDILVGSRRDQQHHDDRACALANRYFDAILVHADPSFARLEDSFRPQAPLTVPVRYTGFATAEDRGAAAVPRARSVIVSAGGGIAGAPLFRAAVAAHRLLWPSRRLPMRIVAGPFLPEPDWRALQAEAGPLEGLRLDRSVPNLAGEIRKAGASVSQCGYNTALELVTSGTPALVVPFAEGREDEQTNRARRLAALGAVRVIESERLSATVLAEEILRTLAFVPSAVRLDSQGARNTARMLREAV